MQLPLLLEHLFFPSFCTRSKVEGTEGSTVSFGEEGTNHKSLEHK